MTIKSIDMQVLVPKVGEVARIQQIQQTEANHRQQEFSQLIMDQTQAHSTTVRETTENQGRTIQERESSEKKKRQSKSQSDKRSDADQTDGEMFKDFHKGGTIDIRV